MKTVFIKKKPKDKRLLDLQSDFTNREMPDVSDQVIAEVEETLDLVGMESVEMPATVLSEGRLVPVNSRLNLYVNLGQADAKGIHMSRLYLGAQKALKSPLNFELLKTLAKELIQSQKGLSYQSRIEVKFEWPVLRKALVSGQKGWRYYPVTMAVFQKNNDFNCELSIEVAYSSTCPCSAALSRQLVKEKFLADFVNSTGVTMEGVAAWLEEESSVVATPHAQRSYANLKLKFKDSMDAIQIIDLVESVLQTPVQSAVKREDEQEFARRNGQNLMFCEDAARRLKKMLSEDVKILDFHIHVSHEESLHPHNAVAIAIKGVPGGFSI